MWGFMMKRITLGNLDTGPKIKTDQHPMITYLIISRLIIRAPDIVFQDDGLRY